MLIEAIRAAILGALPVGCFTFLIVQWSIVSGRLDKFSDEKALSAQYKKIRKEAKEAKKNAKLKKQKGEPEAEQIQQQKQAFFDSRKGGDLFYSKLIFFGGGFYGTMALLTYLIIELFEILSFFGKIIDVSNWKFSFSVQFIVDLIINSIMNIVSAFIWFQTLPKYIEVNNGFIWLAAVYFGYLGGVRFTQARGEQAWQLLSTQLQTMRDKFSKK